MENILIFVAFTVYGPCIDDIVNGYRFCKNSIVTTFTVEKVESVRLPLSLFGEYRVEMEVSACFTEVEHVGAIVRYAHDIAAKRGVVNISVSCWHNNMRHVIFMNEYSAESVEIPF